jgi:hypothetical protein
VPRFWKLTTSGFTITALGSAIYLYFSLFASGGTPFLLSGDQVYFWMGAQRILNGEMPYRDFLQLATPGTDLMFAALFKVFGTRIWVTNLVVVALGVCFACVCFSLSRKLMKDRAAALATCLFMVLIYGKTLNATHHWFGVLLIAIAVRVSMERVTAMSIALSGALLGLATFFSQAHGAAALLGFAAFLLCRSSRPGQTRLETTRMLSLLVLALSSYYLVTVGIEKLWYCLVVCVFEYLPRQSRMPIRLSSMPPASGGPFCLGSISLFLSCCRLPMAFHSGVAGVHGRVRPSPGIRRLCSRWSVSFYFWKLRGA